MQLKNFLCFLPSKCCNKKKRFLFFNYYYYFQFITFLGNHWFTSNEHNHICCRIQKSKQFLQILLLISVLYNFHQFSLDSKYCNTFFMYIHFCMALIIFVSKRASKCRKFIFFMLKCFLPGAVCEIDPYVF